MSTLNNSSNDLADLVQSVRGRLVQAGEITLVYPPPSAPSDASLVLIEADEERVSVHAGWAINAIGDGVDILYQDELVGFVKDILTGNAEEYLQDDQPGLALRYLGWRVGNWRAGDLKIIDSSSGLRRHRLPAWSV